jgi:hypothetical protein
MDRYINVIRNLLHLTLLFSCLLLSPGAAAQDTQSNDAAIAAAIEVLDDYMVAFNSRDSKAWAETLNYPHFRFANGTVSSWENAEAYAEAIDLEALLSSGPWDHSHWLAHEVTLASPQKVHVLTTIRRFSEAHEQLATFKSLYIVTLEDGHWGIKVRSSLAPAQMPPGRN